MLDKDKLWIICYLNISNIDDSETYLEFYNMSKIEPSTLDELNEKLKNFN